MHIIIGPQKNPINESLYFRAKNDGIVEKKETFYILAENGDYITDESGNRLIQEIAP